MTSEALKISVYRRLNLVDYHLSLYIFLISICATNFGADILFQLTKLKKVLNPSIMVMFSVINILFNSLEFRHFGVGNNQA